MSMRYFTLSAVCMLIFCMLLALSGTTDFPGNHHEIVSPSGALSTAAGPGHSGVGQAMASAHPLPVVSEPNAETGSRGAMGGAVPGNRPLLLLGFVLVAVWVLLSFRLFSNSKN